MKIVPFTNSGQEHRDNDNRVHYICVDQIDSNPYQPRSREDEKSISEIAASIKSLGILQPLLARRKENNRYELIAGHRRLAGAEKAGLLEVPVIIKDVTDKEMLQIAIIENIHREDMSPIDKAEGYRRLISQFKMTQNQISEMVGISRSAVANTIRLLDLPENIKKALHEKSITEGHARALLQIKDEERREIALRRILIGNMSVRETEKYSKRVESKETVRDENRGKNSMGLEEESFTEYLQERLGTKVNIRYSGATGRIEIEFYSQEQLRRIADIL